MRVFEIFLPIVVSLIILVVVSIPLAAGAVVDIPTYLSGIAALVVSWISIYFSVIRQVLRRPRIKVEPDIHTVKFDGEKGVRTYIRLRITNVGNSVANNCVGRMLQLLDEERHPIRYDPLYFFWARQDDQTLNFSPIKIHAGDAEVLDIGGIRHKEHTIKFRVSTSNQPLPWGKIFPLSSYFVKVAVYADDMTPYQAWYQIKVNLESLKDSSVEKVKTPKLQEWVGNPKPGTEIVKAKPKKRTRRTTS